MDSKIVSDLLFGFIVFVGVAVIITGIYKSITAKKENLGIGYRIKVILSSVLFATVLFAMACMVISVQNERGEYVRQSHPSSIENITYGQAIDAVFEEEKWSGVNFDKSEDGRTFLQLDGKCRYAGKKREITIQFECASEDISMIDEKTPFRITFVGVDGAEEASDKEMKDFIYYMFETYANRHEISLDQSMRDGILYTESLGENEADSEGSNYIKIIKEGSPEEYDEITYGDAFSDFFSDPDWEYVPSENGKDIVQFTGGCLYAEKDITVCIKFIIKDKTFQCTYMDYDGEKQDQDEINYMIDTVFSSYIEDNEMGEAE